MLECLFIYCYFVPGGACTVPWNGVDAACHANAASDFEGSYAVYGSQRWPCLISVWASCDGLIL